MAQVWRQFLQTIIDKISLLQRKAGRTMTFSDFCVHTDPIFKTFGILKFNVFLQNYLSMIIISMTISQNPFVIFFIKAEGSHSHNIKYAKQGKLVIPSFNASKYGLNSIYKYL